jgi:hypothetical protein
MNALSTPSTRPMKYTYIPCSSFSLVKMGKNPSYCPMLISLSMRISKGMKFLKTGSSGIINFEYNIGELGQ